MLTDEVKKYLERSVLCWLATVNAKNEPNVSPKEMFTSYGDSSLLIANLASPNSVQNIEFNANVCVSFIDIFVQKGFKIKGVANIIERSHPDFEKKLHILTNLFTDNFPIKSIIQIEIQSIERIVAPSYFMFSDTTEQSQIESAMITYQVKPKGDDK